MPSGSHGEPRPHQSVPGIGRVRSECGEWRRPSPRSSGERSGLPRRFGRDQAEQEQAEQDPVAKPATARALSITAFSSAIAAMAPPIWTIPQKAVRPFREPQQVAFVGVGRRADDEVVDGRGGRGAPRRSETVLHRDGQNRRDHDAETPPWAGSG